MSNCHECENNKIVIPRIVFSLVLFCLGFWFKSFSILFFILAFLTAGYDVILKAISNLIKGEIFDEYFLMSLATIGALYIKEYPEAVMVMILYQIGEYLQDKAVHNSEEKIESLIDIRPEYAVIDGNKIEPSKVKIGDIITVRSGEKIPLDGVIINGSASIDLSALTGESFPVSVSEGTEVQSGGINLDGILKIKVTKEYAQSTVNKILKLIQASSEKKAKTEKFITRFAKIYTPIVTIFAILLVLFLPVFTNVSHISSLERALTFLVISCPCALIISVPLTFFAGIGAASSKGVLIKGGNFLEQLSKSGTIVFDKTGTLTTGIFGIKEINSLNPEFLKYLAIAESASNHPIAAAVLKSFEGEIPKITSFKEYSGRGVEVVYDEKTIKAGTAEFTASTPVNTDGTIIYLSINNCFEGYAVLSDMIKQDSKNTIDTLKKMKIKTAMLTGDTEERAKNIGKALGISEVHSKLLPEDKVSKLEEIMDKTKGTTIYAGDGINDAPVLKRADVGIAMGGIGSDSAVETADIVIMDDKPSKIIDAVKISRNTMNIAKQNIIFAIGIKILFLILGMFGLMTMWGAVFADVGVALLAISNSLRASK